MPPGTDPGEMVVQPPVTPDAHELLEVLVDTIVRYDADGRIAFVNEQFTRRTGRRLHEVVGMRPFEWAEEQLLVADVRQYRLMLAETLATGEPRQVTRIPPDGEIFQVLFRATTDADGVVTGAYALARNVSDLVRARRDLAEREHEFRALAENLPDLLVRYDRDARVIYANRPIDGLHIHGARSDLRWQLPSTPTETEPGDPWVAAYEIELRRVIETGEPVTIERRVVAADGGERVFSVLVRAEHSADQEIVGAVALGRDITNSVRQREALERTARTDSLTGLPSRAELYRRLPAIIEQHDASGEHLAVMLFDLDGFKHINDQYGHRLGDEMLVAIGGALASCCGEDDLLVRLGGDEFVLVLTGVHDPADAADAAQRARRSLHGLGAERRARFPVVDTSAGIAVFPDHGTDVDTLLAHADLALYEAKRRGHGVVEYFQPDLRDALERRFAVTQALGECVPDDEFALHLQPICTFADDRGAWGAEALLRWTHPVLGSIAPDEFIPLAEQSGQIVELGRWVLDRAAAIAVELNRGRSEPLRVTVNVSTRQFTLDDIGEAVRSALASAGCDPRWIVVELTESLLLEDLPLVHRGLDALRALGVSLAIDDFGTGYSSMQYLSRLQVDFMKVDKSFVRDADVDRHQQEIVRALVAMAQALGIGVIAEGVETEGQAQLLHELGCGLLQGYLIAHPMPVDDATSWLAAASGESDTATPDGRPD